MERTFLIGIPEIDAQHRGIVEMVESLREAIASGDQRHLIYPILKRLHHLCATHFAYEEEIMRLMNYPNLEQHTKSHKKLLQLLKSYFDHPLAPADHDHFGSLVYEKVLAHIAQHDKDSAAIAPEDADKAAGQNRT